MQRRKFIQHSALALATLAFYKSNGFAQALRAYQFKPLRNDVGIFTEQGGTIAWLNSNNGFAVVDAQFPASAANVINELKKLSDQPFRYLLNTHHHGDHTAGNIAFKGLVQEVVAHKNSLINQKIASEKANSQDKQLLPNLTFDKNWKAEVGKEKIAAHYYGAGHTNGDAIYHFQNANIVHLGDLVFNRRYPYIDKENGANIGNWIKVLDQITNDFDQDTLFIFGHSLDPEKITGNKTDIKAFRDYLEALLVFVKSEINVGKSKEDILKATAIPHAPEWKGDGILRSLNAAYAELTSGK